MNNSGPAEKLPQGYVFARSLQQKGVPGNDPGIRAGFRIFFGSILFISRDAKSPWLTSLMKY